MNILFLPSVMKEADFGGLIHQTELVSGLAKLTDLYIIPKGGGKAVRVKDGRELPIMSKGGTGNYFRHIYRTLRWGLASSGKDHIDVIYARHGISTVPAIAVGRLRGTPVIIEVNGILSDEFKLSNSSRLTHFLMKRLDRIAFTKPGKIVVVTEELKEYITEKYRTPEERISVVLNGVNTELFRPMDRNHTKGKIGLEPGTRYICFIGSLASWQGVEYFIRAVPEITDKFGDVHFLIVGDGPMRPDLERIVAELVLEKDVTFTGAVPYREIPFYINSSHLCVLPKRPLKSGYSPLKLYEYMACGRPVVVSRNKGLDIVEKIGSGILTEPENTHDLAKGILFILAHEEEAEAMGKRGRAYAEKEGSWDSVAQKVFGICGSVSDGKK